jgi:hypothetical protein
VTSDTTVHKSMNMAQPNGSPPWPRLAILAGLVVLAHMLLLQATPARLGARFDRDARENRSFATRSIEAPPAPQAMAATPAPIAPALPKKAKSNPPPAPLDVAKPAVDSIADSPPQPVPEPSAATEATATSAQLAVSSLPLPSSTASSSTAAATALPAGPQTTPVTAINLPGSTLLLYKMTGTSKGLTYQADSELGWNNNGSQYEAYMKVSALFLGARSMTSAGQITASGLAPTRFADKFRSELAAHFQPEKGKITFSANTPDAPWIEGAQDRVSVFLQLGGMLAAKPDAFPVGSEITLYTVGPRDADAWTFTVEAEEKLNLPKGDVATIKLTRKPRREFDQKVEIWYAPSLGYLPVRNRITQQNGDFIDQQLSNIGGKL